MNQRFNGNTIITAFDELEQFTGITALPAGCFQDCRSLRRITIPTNVTSMSWNTFRNSPQMEYIKILPTSLVSLNGGNGLYNTNNCPVFVPDDLVDMYKAASYWSQYASRIKGFSELSS